MNQAIEEKEQMIRLLEALHPGVKIYLFGSRARGTARATSDVDLALDIGRPMQLHEIGQARELIYVLYIPYKVDIVDMQSVPEKLREIILREGIVWKS